MISKIASLAVAGTTCGCGRPVAWALAGLVLVGGTSPAWAPVLPGGPTADHVYAGCTLDFITVQRIQNRIALAPGIASGVVGFIVVYALRNENSGQSLVGGPAKTGPVICTAPGIVADPTREDEILEDVDVLSADEALVLRYGFSSGFTLPQDRFCHTVKGNVDCYNVSVATE